jgi:hypothetical protein
MKHIRSSVKGRFVLEHNGIPTSNLTDFSEPIITGSLCIDTLNADLYIFKGIGWQKIGSGGGSSTGGNVDISYYRAQPTKVALGGMPQGTIPNFPTIQDLLDDVLYPFVAPTISLSSSSLHEKGLVVNKSMNYSITLNDGIVSSRQILLNNIPESAIVTNSGTYNSPSNLTWANSPTPVVLYYPHTYTFRVNFTNSSQLNSSILVEFASPTYHGVLASGSINNQASIKTLTKRIRKKANDATLNFSPTLQRYVYAYPAVYGDLVSIIDQNGFNVTASFTKTVMNFTLADLSIESYHVYASTTNTTQVNFKNTFNFS